MTPHQRRIRLAARAWHLTEDELFDAERGMGLSSPPQRLTHPHSHDAGQPWSPWGSIAETET